VADRRAVVIGAGITGILTARELLLDGWEVTVLEASHVGAGSSSRTAAGIRQQFSTPGTVHGMRYCVDFYQRFASEVLGGTCPIVQNGYLFLYDDEAKWEAAKRTAAMQREAGVEVELLEGDDLPRRFDWVAHDLVGGTFCPTDGFLLPHLVYNDGARRVRELGGVIRQRTPVIDYTRDGDRLREVLTPKGAFGADVFVDATNAWTRRLAGVLDAELLQVDPLKRYLWFVARGGPMSGDTLASMPLVISPQGGHCRPENRDSMQLGKKHDTSPQYDFTYEDQDEVEPHYAHDGGVDAQPYELWAEMAACIPDLEHFEGLTATTGGFYGTTPDHNPFLGFDRQRTNLLRLVGFSGHGAMMGPFTAAVARALCNAGHDLPSIELGGQSIPLDAFRIGRSYDHSEAMVI
jgi:glycine/D-amino acid oxidase-like deaminating enzyme